VPSPISYDFHACSPLMCSYCQSFDHDVNSCPYYDAFDKWYARLDATIGIMNEQHEQFVSRMRECVYCMRLTLVYLALDLRLVSIMILSLPFPLSLMLLVMHL